MKNRRVALTLILCMFCAVIFSCSSAMVMFAKGVNAVMQMNQKFDDFKDVKIQINIASYNRPRPALTFDTVNLAEPPREFNSFSKITFYSKNSTKYGVFDGTIQVNDKPFTEQLNGVYISPDSVPASGSDVKLTFKTTAGKETVFSQKYNVEKIKILKPEAGASVDVTNGFTVEWTKGSNPERLVKVSIIAKMYGQTEMVLPVAVFPDTGKGIISKKMLENFCDFGGWGIPYDPATGSLNVSQSNELLIGPNSIIVERYSDEIKKDLNGCLVYSEIAGDCVNVTTTGTGPALPADRDKKDYKSGRVTLTVVPKYRTATQLPDDYQVIKTINKISLASFEMYGNVGLKKETSTATERQWADLQKDSIEALTTAMGQYYTKEIAEVFGAQIVPSEKLKTNPAYYTFFLPAETKVEGDDGYGGRPFYATAAGLGKNPEEDRMNKLLPVQVQDVNADVFLSMAKTSETDLLLFGSFYIDLISIEDGKWTFNVTMKMYGYFFPLKNSAQIFRLPVATSTVTSEPINWKDDNVDVKFKKLGFFDFINAYKQSLTDMKAKSL